MKRHECGQTRYFRKMTNGCLAKSIFQARANAMDDKASFIWKNAAPPRVQLFMWLLLQGRIHHLGLQPWQQSLEEARALIGDINGDELPAYRDTGCSYAGSRIPTLIALVCWHIWKARNSAVFRNRSLSIKSCCPANWLLNSGKLARLSRKKRHIAEKWCTIFNMARQGQG